jgi:hypothetical protein
MKEKLIEILNLKPGSAGQPITDDQILDAVASLQKRVATFEAEQCLAASDEEVIRQKMAVGLSREQAIAVIRRQRAFDAAPI